MSVTPQIVQDPKGKGPLQRGRHTGTKELTGTWPISTTEGYEKITAWFVKDPEVQALVFKNHDLGHPELGHLVFIPWWKSDGDLPVTIGGRLPDNWAPSGIGWRYILMEAVTDPTLFHNSEETYQTMAEFPGGER